MENIHLHVLEPYVLYKFRQILKSTFDNMLVLEGFNDLINTKQLYMMIDKTNDIEINFDEFSEHLPNERIKSIFKSSLNNTISNGLVVEDEAGNQYVWIPVKNAIYDGKTTIATSNNSSTYKVQDTK